MPMRGVMTKAEADTSFGMAHTYLCDVVARAGFAKVGVSKLPAGSGEARIMFLRNAVLAACLALSLPATPGRAEPILTVAGPARQVDLDMAALEALPQVSFATSTVWTDGTHQFSGVPLKALLAAQGITGGAVKAIALNDYSVTIPVDSLEDTAPILATRIDGKTFSRREKGPIWLIYPFDAAERFRTELIFGRSIWQLRRLEAIHSVP